MTLDKKHYPKDWVVLQNRVVECFKSMTLDEKRLFMEKMRRLQPESK